MADDSTRQRLVDAMSGSGYSLADFLQGRGPNRLMDHDTSPNALAPYANTIPSPHDVLTAFAGPIHDWARDDAEMLRHGVEPRPRSLFDIMGALPIGPFGTVRPGFDMTQAARLARAREMGFDTDRVLYHGSSSSFDEFRPPREGSPIYLTDSPDIASIYANIRNSESQKKHAAAFGRSVNAGPNIVPVYVRNQNPLVISDRGPDGSHGWTSDNLAAALGVPHPPAGRYRELYDEARRRGHDLVEIRNMLDLGGEQTQYLALDPTNIRSVNAAFDPAQRLSRNLMYGLPAPLAGGAAASSLMGDRSQ